MKTLNVLMIITCCLLAVGISQTHINTTNASSDCDLCGYGNNVTHYTYNYLRYECIYCDDEWIQFYNVEANSASQCYTYLSSSTMSGLCSDHTTCGTCLKFGSDTHHDHYYAKYICWDRSSTWCEWDKLVWLRSIKNSYSSCSETTEKDVYYQCEPCRDAYFDD